MDNPNITIHKMLDVPTNELCVSSIESLEFASYCDTNPLTNLSVYKKQDYGYFIYLIKGWQNDVENIPKDLYKICQLAEKLECDIICIDRDVPPFFETTPEKE